MNLIHNKINYRSRIVSPLPMAQYAYRQRVCSRSHFLRVLISYGDRPKGTPQLRPLDTK